MKHPKLTLAAIVIAATVMVILWIPRTTSVVFIRPAQTPLDLLTHPQLVWLYSLEHLESQGKVGAINPKDRDGTPSYGCLQFKPGTLYGYAKEFGVASSSLMDCSFQEDVTAEMILHRNQIDWHQQFPVSVSKIGLPPANPQQRS